jgi:hypothetical protein
MIDAGASAGLLKRSSQQHCLTQQQLCRMLQEAYPRHYGLDEPSHGVLVMLLLLLSTAAVGPCGLGLHGRLQQLLCTCDEVDRCTNAIHGELGTPQQCPRMSTTLQPTDSCSGPVLYNVRYCHGQDSGYTGCIASCQRHNT